MNVYRRHALLGAGRRLVDVALQIHRAAFAEDDVLVDGDRALVGLRIGRTDAEGGQASVNPDVNPDANPGGNPGGSEEAASADSIHRW